MRGSTRRAWIKVFVTGWLHGSIRWQLSPAERGCFADLLCMAGECNKDGKICDNDGKAFPWTYLSEHFHIPLELLESTLKKCQADGRISLDDGVINIVNWKVYQSEYNRQKEYRQRAGKEKYGEFNNVFLAQSEHAKLVERFGEVATDKLIETLSSGIQSKGYKYKDHYATILNWERRDGKSRGDTAKPKVERVYQKPEDRRHDEPDLGYQKDFEPPE